MYSESLELPLQKAKRTLIYSNFLYALSQSMSFWVIALVFFVGSRWIVDGTVSSSALVSRVPDEYRTDMSFFRLFVQYDTNKFFVVLMSVVFGAIQAGNGALLSSPLSPKTLN